MKVVLAAQSFINKDLTYNFKKILYGLERFSQQKDLILYGESFLQGFDSLTWNYDKDIEIAISIDDKLIKELRFACKKYKIGLSFGFIEKDQDYIYSSQLTIDRDSNIINLYRRVSQGWKEKISDFHYKEGKEFKVFYFCSKKVLVSLCGDLWYEDNIKKINELKPDLVLWPVYTDFNYKEWNSLIKFEYLKQASKISSKVLYVNSFCKDKNEREIARGGAALFYQNKIIKEVEAGKEAYLSLEI